jgi:rare lipoprotein A
VRSVATLVVAVLVAGSITADAHHGRKRGPANHLHRLASVAHRGKASPVPVEQIVELRPSQPITDFFEKGLASIWSGGWTSDGKRVRPSDMACAHRTLPLGTVVHVTYERTKRSVLVTVRDRGPYKRGRILDLRQAQRVLLGSTSALALHGLCSISSDPVAHVSKWPTTRRCFLVCRYPFVPTRSPSAQKHAGWRIRNLP